MFYEKTAVTHFCGRTSKHFVWLPLEVDFYRDSSTVFVAQL